MAVNSWLITEKYSYLTDCVFAPVHSFQAIALSDHEVHLWLADLDLPAAEIQTLNLTLSNDEQQRAARFRFDRDRHAFIAARGILRTILGRYLNLPPAQVRFTYSDRGKPQVATINSPTLQFNLSHSSGKALYAINRDRRVGVDLEHHRSVSDAEQLAQRFFSEQEYSLLSALPPAQKPAAFFSLWTCKEAYLKATGDGLLGLDHACIAFDPTEPFKLLGIQGSAQTPDWAIAQFQPLPDYTAALAVEGQAYHLLCLQQKVST